MKQASEAGRYHIKPGWLQALPGRIRTATDQELEQWAADPNCYEREVAANKLAERRTLRGESDRNKPFDPRTEISADARHIAGRIVTHLWIILVLLPCIIGLLWVISAALR